MIDGGVESLFEGGAVERTLEDERSGFVESTRGFVAKLTGEPDFPAVLR